MTRALERYIGVPFRDRGEDLTGTDCWRLVRIILREQAGVEVPAYGETPALDMAGVEREVDAAILSPTWRRVPLAEARAFDVVLMQCSRRVGEQLHHWNGHVGVMVDGFLMIHIEERTASVMVPVNHPLIRHRIVAFYRHAELQ